jgi:cob(I)alamin adenosyltransferase
MENVGQGTMTDQPFDQPRVRINRVYTRRGDGGETWLAGGQKVPKDSPRIEAYGTVDELNAAVGMARQTAAENAAWSELEAMLKRVQHELFNLGSILATLPEDVHPRQPRVTGSGVEQLEREMDRMTAELPALRSFVLPGGCRLNAELHLCRTLCRRAERRVVTLARAEPEGVPEEAVRYLNRLGDALFVWSRWANRAAGVPEVLWEPNLAVPARNTNPPAPDVPNSIQCSKLQKER